MKGFGGPHYISLGSESTYKPIVTWLLLLRGLLSGLGPPSTAMGPWAGRGFQSSLAHQAGLKPAKSSDAAAWTGAYGNQTLAAY